MSERIVEHLHGRRWFWIAVWALVPWVNALVNLSLDDEERSAVWHQGTTAVLSVMQP